MDASISQLMGVWLIDFFPIFNLVLGEIPICHICRFVDPNQTAQIAGSYLGLHCFAYFRFMEPRA